MPVSLGKLIKKQALMPLLLRWVEDLDTSLKIEDDQGKLLLATENAQNLHRYPVTAANTVIGWVIGTEKVAVIASVLGKMALAEMEKRDLVQETLSKYKEITLLCDTVEKVSSCLDTKEVARLVIEEARRVIQLSSISILLFNDETGTLDVIGQYGSQLVSVSANHKAGIVGTVWTSGQAQIVNDVHSDLRLMEDVDAVSALMCAPLKAKEKIVGVILVGNDLPVAYTAEDLKLFTTLTFLAASVIENAGLYEQLNHAFQATLCTLAETIEKRDPYTGNHTKRVVEYSLAIGKTLGLSAQDMIRLQMGAVLHDIGKIGVRDNVLLKDSRLTEEEFQQIKKHPVYGQEIVANIPGLKSAVDGVMQHHEKFDGTGYPRGLKGDQIDMTARIIAVADSFDAMTSNRPYRDGLSLDVAFEELKKYSGSQFDPAVVDAFFASDVMEAFFTANARQKIMG